MSTTHTHTVQSRNPWRTTIVAGMASYLDAGALTTLGPFLVLMKPTLGLTDADIGLISGLMTLCFAIGAVFGGRLGDKYGRKRVFTFTLILFAVGTAAMVGAFAIPMLYLGVVLMGLAIGADLPVSLALIAEEAPEGKKGKMVTFTSFLWLFGAVLPSFITAVVAPMGVTGARILYGQLLVTAIIVLILRLTLRESAEWSAAKKLRTAELLEGSEHQEIQFSQLKQLFRKPIVFSMVALGIYYGIWGLAGNTLGQFSAFIWTDVAGLPLETQGLLGLASLPLGVIAVIIFLRVVDRPSRQAWFIFGTIIGVVSFFIPAVFGFSFLTLAFPLLLLGFSSGFSGETVFKVWSQELMPTLLRSTSQGITIAFARLIAAVFAVFTPAFAHAAPQLLFGVLGGFLLIAGIIGIFIVPKLPTAQQLEPDAPVVVADDKSTVTAAAADADPATTIDRGI